MIQSEEIEKLVVEHAGANKLAVGNDIIYLPNFKQSLTPEFIARVYTQEELQYCRQFDEPVLRYASTWAAKEAVYKAIKQIDDTIKLWWPDIEILRNKPQGKPTASITKLTLPLQITLSIAHDGDYVWAVAVVCIQQKK